MKRFFLPLCTEAYEDFKDYGKRYEIRAYRRQYNPEQLVDGRIIELRKGYSGESLWGTIGDYVVGTLEELFTSLPLNDVEPRAKSIDDAVEENKELLGEHDFYIAFEIILD